MNLPASFIAYTRSLLGEEEYEKLAAALELEPPVSVRLNQTKWPVQLAHRVPWSAQGFYLEERPTFTFDPLFHAGCYYVQEASSMFVEQVVRQYVAAPVVILDLCAAPGGKSTHIRSVLPEGSLLVANEVMRNRSQILAENLTKWGHPDVVVTNNDPADFASLPFAFDVILTDVPCSGEGMFRKDPVAIEEWSPENVEICWQRQRQIIADIWPVLKPGGILIYSTCTYNMKEDEENVRWICKEFGAEILPLAVKDEWQLTGDLLSDSFSFPVSQEGGQATEGCSLPVVHFLPHKTVGEGFFLAALRKPLADEEIVATACRSSKNKASKKKDKKGEMVPALVKKEHLSLAQSWLREDIATGYFYEVEGANLCLIPKQHADEVAALKRVLKVISAGVKVGEVKGKDLLPDHALAMSAGVLRPEAFPTEDLSYEQAIAYLRKEAIILSAEAPRGFVLLTYRDVPLGFVKNIGNRANNLYPQEWRIRSSYLPEELRFFL
ncbi:tRNA and rRNA cytosine-C5-methylase [gut metagenome]|uniref:tRNA and rRNA cytosine-C5-methylase n=1 Tax=gut metagenome TaxID=749906 RepID=J9D0Z9_9ZZZZ